MQVFGNGRARLAKNAAVILALASAALALSGKPHAALDIAIRDTGGHALLRIGFATVSVAFGSEHLCSKSNSCAGLLP